AASPVLGVGLGGQRNGGRIRVEDGLAGLESFLWRIARCRGSTDLGLHGTRARWLARTRCLGSPRRLDLLHEVARALEGAIAAQQRLLGLGDLFVARRLRLYHRAGGPFARRGAPEPGTERAGRLGARPSE